MYMCTGTYSYMYWYVHVHSDECSYDCCFTVETITQVYTVEELKNEQAAKFGAGQNSFTGIMFAYLTSFDIDQDINRVVCYRW